MSPDTQIDLRRLRCFPVCPELLFEEWKRLDGTRLMQVLNLPADARYVRAFWDSNRDTLFVIAEHASFDPVRPGEIVPQGSIEFRASRVISNAEVLQ